MSMGTATLKGLASLKIKKRAICCYCGGAALMDATEKLPPGGWRYLHHPDAHDEPGVLACPSCPPARQAR